MSAKMSQDKIRQFRKLLMEESDMKLELHKKKLELLKDLNQLDSGTFSIEYIKKMLGLEGAEDKQLSQE